MKRQWLWLWWWLKDHTPVICIACLRLLYFKDARHVQLLTGQHGHLCPSCYLDYFFGDQR